ncbi:translation initiation factor IF-2-like [Homo sapiens]|uniref:translation initiation factor IF-2-like n=1 Tax=Homo sapiens TaxID=9606 RepID=UPI0023DFC423|nr:translation initiation factor IF-2-like [Homo sapiens]
MNASENNGTAPVQAPFSSADSSAACASAGFRPGPAKPHLTPTEEETSLATRGYPARPRVVGEGALRQEVSTRARAPAPRKARAPSPAAGDAVPVRTPAHYGSPRSLWPSFPLPQSGRTLAPALCVFLVCGSHAELVWRGEWGGQSPGPRDRKLGIWTSSSVIALWVSGHRPGPCGPLGPLARPPGTFGKLVLVAGGKAGDLSFKPFTANGSVEGGRAGEGHGGGGEWPASCLRTHWRAKGLGGGVAPPIPFVPWGYSSREPDSSLLLPYRREPPPARRLAATPLAGSGRLRPRDPSRFPALANGGATNGTTCSSLAVSSWAVHGSLGRLCWKGRRGESAGGSGAMASAPLPTTLFPWSRRTTAQPIGLEMWRVATSLWVSAALFCLVTDTLEMKFMTSSLRLANRKSSRGEVFLPLRLSFFTRVSERARAEGVGKISSRVARMSGEAPPPRLYIKGWRGARRRHFVLEWSSL